MIAALPPPTGRPKKGSPFRLERAVVLCVIGAVTCAVLHGAFGGGEVAILGASLFSVCGLAGAVALLARRSPSTLSEVGAPLAGPADAWRCPSCKAVNNKTRARCFNCDTPPPPGTEVGNNMAVQLVGGAGRRDDAPAHEVREVDGVGGLDHSPAAPSVFSVRTTSPSSSDDAQSSPLAAVLAPMEARGAPERTSDPLPAGPVRSVLSPAEPATCVAEAVRTRNDVVLVVACCEGRETGYVLTIAGKPPDALLGSESIVFAVVGPAQGVRAAENQGASLFSNVVSALRHENVGGLFKAVAAESEIHSTLKYWLLNEPYLEFAIGSLSRAAAAGLVVRRAAQMKAALRGFLHAVPTALLSACLKTIQGAFDTLPSREDVTPAQQLLAEMAPAGAPASTSADLAQPFSRAFDALVSTLDVGGERTVALRAVVDAPPASEPLSPRAEAPELRGDAVRMSSLPGEVRTIFWHVERHGSITESEIVRLLGGARQFRRFSNNFDAYASAVPFRVRIEVGPDGKRYVKEGEK